MATKHRTLLETFIINVHGGSKEETITIERNIRIRKKIHTNKVDFQSESLSVFSL